MSFCTACGNCLGSGDKFCSQCGRATGISRSFAFTPELSEETECTYCDGSGRVGLGADGTFSGMLATVVTLGVANLQRVTCPKCKGTGKIITIRQ